MTGIQFAALLISVAALAFSIYTAYRTGEYRAERNHHLNRLEQANQRTLELRQKQINLLEGLETPKNASQYPQDRETN